ncbi:MAG: PAS domain-containing protein [Candidatus Latescibacteria bacterium]|nr:PAS domain-containing protein [Candidatus Latescibacterota bacterium]
MDRAWGWLLPVVFAGGGLALSTFLEGTGLGLGLLVLAAGYSGAHLWLTARGLRRVSEEVLALAAGSSTRANVPAPFRSLGVALDELGRWRGNQVALLQSEQTRLAALLDSVAAGILVVDQQGRVVLANRALAEFFGLQAPPQGKRHPEVARSAQAQEAIDLALAQGVAATRELSLPGGRQLEVQAVPIRRDGQGQGVVAVFYDLTRIRRLERMRKDFVANVSHELRTPLTAIKGCAETLADGALHDPQTTARFVKIIDDHAGRLTRLLDDLLNLARLEADQLELQQESCRVRGLVDACLSAVAQTAAAKGLEIAVEIAPELSALCDRRLVEQGLINLLDNAVKYTPEGGRIRVWAGAAGAAAGLGQTERVEILPGHGAGRRIEVLVADTGIGIPGADLRRVFERFYRVDKGRSRAQGGTGLGLSIVRHVVEVHGERLWVASVLGQGTTFGFTLQSA